MFSTKSTIIVGKMLSIYVRSVGFEPTTPSLADAPRIELEFSFQHLKHFAEMSNCIKGCTLPAELRAQVKVIVMPHYVTIANLSSVTAI